MDFFAILTQISLIACFQAIFLALALIFIKRGDRTLNRIFGSLLLVNAWSGIYYTIDLMGRQSDYTAICYTNFLSDFAYNALFLIYVLRLTKPNYQITWRSFLHFIPVVIMFGYYANYYFASSSVKQEIFARGYNYFPYDVAVFSYINLVQLVIYLGMAAFLISRYNRKIKQFYSETGKRNYNWISLIFIFNLFSAVICFFLFKTGWVIFGVTLTLISVVLIFIIGYKMLSNPLHVPDPEIEITQKITAPEGNNLGIGTTKYERSGLSEQKARQIMSELDALMRNEKPYLDPELNLKQLADRLKIVSHHLSQVINQVRNKNFYDYINEYRVEEVKQRLANQEFAHLTILAIGFDSGFNSKAGFNSVFKKITGMSPSEYRRNIPADYADLRG